ncbi:MAG: MFS transporter, partial [Candidatus Helarchaeota archaeon]
MKNRELFFLGIADMSGMILMTAIIFHYQNYYINTLFVGNSYAYLLGFLVPTISLFIGAFAYPISGYFSDRLSTRFGRRRPFFFLAIPGGISFGLVSMPMFVQIGINFSNNFLSGYIFILTFYILF